MAGKCRFIEEYANFQKNQFKKDIKHADMFGDENKEYRIRFCKNAVETIDRAVQLARHGLITVNECMAVIANPGNYTNL